MDDRMDDHMDDHMALGTQLVDASLELLRQRWPGVPDAVAAAVLLEDGRILTSVGLDNINAAANLCAETGALIRAYTLDAAVVASACVAGGAESGVFRVLAPCGICRERLALWGPEVLAAVPGAAGGSSWEMLSLRELNPYYWAASFTVDGSWPSTAGHRE